MPSPKPQGLWKPAQNGTAPPAGPKDKAKSKDAGRPARPAAHKGPIIHEARWDGKLPRARAHVAVVVVYYRGSHQVIWPHQRDRVLLHRRPATTYEVDLGLHRTVITADLPSCDFAASFHARISIQWRVADPYAIVRHQVLDIDEVLSASLLRQARLIARAFRTSQVIAAEDTINETLAGAATDVTEPASTQQASREATNRGSVGAEYGLWTRAIVHLSLDQAATEHSNKMMQLNWALEEEKAEQELRILKDQNLQQITTERIKVYRKIIDAGDVEQFALRLASHPDEISAITAIIREDQLTSRRDTIDFISHMVDSGVVERWEVSDQVREALEWLREATARVVTNKDHMITQDGPSARQHRRGRTKPAEKGTAPQPPPEVIVVGAEPSDTATESAASADAPDQGE